MEKILLAIHWIRRFLKKAKSDRVDAYAAQSAFYVIMGFIPFIMLLLALLRFTPLTPALVMDLLMGFLPESFRDVLMDVVGGLFTQSTALLSGTAIAAIWASGRAVLAVTNGLNSVYGLEETRNYIYMRLRSACYILLFLFAIVIAMLLLVFGSQVHDAIIAQIPLLREFSGFLISLRTVATIVLLMLLFMCMYQLLPNKKEKFMKQLPGAMITAIAWSVFSFAFSIYFEHAKGMATIYGSLTVAVMIMLWLYFCMWFIFMGAEINCYIDDSVEFESIELKKFIIK